MNTDYVTQVGELVLHDGEGLCEVVGPLRSGEDAAMEFEMRNPNTGQQYLASVKVEEV